MSLGACSRHLNPSLFAGPLFLSFLTVCGITRSSKFGDSRGWNRHGRFADSLSEVWQVIEAA